MELHSKSSRIAASLSWLKESTCLSAETRFRHLATTLTIHRLMGWSKGCTAMLGHGLTTLVHGKRDRWDEYLPQVTIGTSDSNTRCDWILPFLPSVRIHPRLPTDETPSSKYFGTLDEIERNGGELRVHC
ncbi:hypothetical protein BASA81_018463 [Batrachochytrium salamandrivorans]|nr:hypothetical protein BASA81_018463 [Batrachochytrium salamandrivorans]